MLAVILSALNVEVGNGDGSNVTWPDPVTVAPDGPQVAVYVYVPGVCCVTNARPFAKRVPVQSWLTGLLLNTHGPVVADQSIVAKKPTVIWLLCGVTVTPGTGTVAVTSAWADDAPEPQVMSKTYVPGTVSTRRSEERRVGKECR